MDFSDVYYDIENAFVVRGNDGSIATLDDLRGKIATVQIGTAQDTFITGNGPSREIKRFQKNDDALMEVKVGRGDFSVLNLTVANAFLRNNKPSAKTSRSASATRSTGKAKESPSESPRETKPS